MELQPLFHRVIGLDVHQVQVTACAILTNPDGIATIERRQFGAFQKDRKALALWCAWGLGSNGTENPVKAFFRSAEGAKPWMDGR